MDRQQEIAGLVQGWVLNDMNDPHARESLEGRIESLCARVEEEAAVRGVDAVMRHDIQFVNEQLRKAIAKDVNAAIRRSKGEG